MLRRAVLAVLALAAFAAAAEPAVLTLGERAERHVRESHFAGGRRSRGKSLFLPGTDETLAVPKAAVLEDEGRSFVFVHYQGEYYVRRPVVRGRTWAGWVEIKKGLEPSQVVVVEGAFLMKSDVLRSKMGAGCAD